MNQAFFQHRAEQIKKDLSREQQWFAWWIGRYSNAPRREWSVRVFNSDWFHKLHGTYERRLRRILGVPQNRHDRWDERLFGGTPYGDMVIDMCCNSDLPTFRHLGTKAPTIKL